MPIERERKVGIAVEQAVADHGRERRAEGEQRQLGLGEGELAGRREEAERLCGLADFASKMLRGGSFTSTPAEERGGARTRNRPMETKAKRQSTYCARRPPNR